MKRTFVFCLSLFVFTGAALAQDFWVKKEYTQWTEEEARKLNEAFITYKTGHRPFGILKLAMTLDGKIATRTGESRWISSEESRASVHKLRHRATSFGSVRSVVR